MVWTDSWPSIAGAGCGLICVGAGEEWARKVYALRGLRGVERQVGLTRGTWWPAGSSAGCMVVLTMKIRQPSHEFTFGVGISFIPYPLVLTPVVEQVHLCMSVLEFNVYVGF
jgi:hypothetical protein